MVTSVEAYSRQRLSWYEWLSARHVWLRLQLGVSLRVVTFSENDWLWLRI